MSLAQASPEVAAPEVGAADRPRRRPDRSSVVDSLLLLALGSAALTGFALTFTGWGFLVVGVLGLLIGVLLGLLTTGLRWPAVAPILLAMAAFYLLGGPLTLRSVDALLPVPHTWRLLTDQVLFGWKDLLTTLPPVDGAGTLLALPWALGLATGSLGVVLARVRSGPLWFRSVLPLLAPSALLSLVILLGVQRPQSLWIQGAAFAGFSLAWLILRGQRSVTTVQGRGRSSRLLVAVTVVVATGLLAPPVSAWVLGSDQQRVILRTQVDPPFDIGQYPSPLASFRRYIDPGKDSPPENVHDKTLFTIDGVATGDRVRFATLDRYDGVVWGAANDTIPGATNDTYQRVSSTIDNPVPGRRVAVTVTIGEGYGGVWLPVVGALQTLRFEVGDAEAKADTFRYNLAASTAVVPSGLRPGDSYSFTAVVPDDALSPDLTPSTNLGEAAAAALFLDTAAQEWSSGESLPMRRVFAIAQHLKEEGRYTDGVSQAEKIYHAGHSMRRLSDEFVNWPIIAGDDEQYAATMALLANRVGVPARVVMGAVVPAGGEVRGSDVQAWVELQAEDGSWRTLPTEQFMGKQRPAELPPQDNRDQTGTNVPPPAPIPPPSVIGDQADSELKARKGNPTEDGPSAARSVPGWLLRAGILSGGLVSGVLMLMGAVAATKLVRRRRRRRATRVSARFVGGWRELVDHARDLGQTVPVDRVTTRREQSVVLDSGVAPELAREADSRVFGPSAPLAVQAETFWSAINAERKSMSTAASRRRRFRAALSLRSFRRGAGAGTTTPT